MERTAISLAVAAAMTAGLAINAQAGTVRTEGEDIIISTKNGGFSAKTESGDFSFKVSGKLQWDYASLDGVYNSENEGKDKTTGYVRRGQLKISGKAHKNFKYALKLKLKSTDANDNDFVVDNAYLDFLHLNPVEVRLGKWGRDFGLENTTSSSWIMGIERPFIYDVMRGDETNDYGIQAAIYEKQYTLAAGIHHDGLTDYKNNDDDSWGFTARATVAPIMSDNTLVHLGVSYHNTNPDKARTGENKTKLGVKKSSSQTLYNVSSGGTDFTTSGDSEIILEAAAQLGSVQVQGEYMMRGINQKDTTNTKADVDLSGYYGQVSYMLGGGKRTYKDGAFGKPSGGQWEVFVRYASLTVDAKGTAYAGTDPEGRKDVEVDAMTLGVNYFPTKNIRASLNYVTGNTSNLIDKTAVYTGTSKRRDVDGSAVVGRVQFVF
ncbi:OprO/OprP family phosphate-selective porin [Sansalvadorimonas verongulae]|uniref:OprO/OprP family phosphate-selective porin n=1 Tax=Sansalvadorimonas verongulae TaxID=2172824 RepID=UPI0012BB5DD5|nr:porin [Sansalvadorimonas verongulae]MTI12724.1 hypothetical protein [Sansalvadorimonas verongulae]